MQITALDWINHLKLQPHPEGGYYKEVFRSKEEILCANSASFLTNPPSSCKETATKQACTSIYYLLEGEDFSGFHRLASDELWYFHKGAPLHIHVIDEQGTHTTIELSDSPTGSLQAVITPNTWFAAEIPSRNGFSLVSCAVAPGFDFAEFEMAQKEKLTGQYPQHQTLLERLCRA